MAKSTHLPFEDWLVSERPLSAYQAQAMQEHLQDCEACRQLKESLTGVNRLFRSAPQAAPRLNFTARWMERQAAEKLVRQRQQAWIIFSIFSINALALLALLGSQMVALFNSPTQMLLVRAYLVSIGMAFYQMFEAFFVSGLKLSSGFPLVGLALFTGFTSFLSVLWLVTYRQLTSAPRRVTL